MDDPVLSELLKEGINCAVVVSVVAVLRLLMTCGAGFPRIDLISPVDDRGALT